MLECLCCMCRSPLFFFNDTATTEIYTLSLHDALPISRETWEKAYADAQARFEAHRKQIAAAKEADAEAAAGTNYSSDDAVAGDGETAGVSAGGTLASDEALAALRAKLAGGE